MDCDSRVSQDWISLDYVPEELLKDASVCAGFLDVISLHFGEVIIKWCQPNPSNRIGTSSWLVWNKIGRPSPCWAWAAWAAWVQTCEHQHLSQIPSGAAKNSGSGQRTEFKWQCLQTTRTFTRQQDMYSLDFGYTN